MSERELSRGVIFEPREDVTIFGNKIKKQVQVVAVRGSNIRSQDIDRAIELIEETVQIDDKYWQQHIENQPTMGD